MSAQRLSARSIRRIERGTSLSIRRAWSHGGYVFAFVTDDHRHGVWDKKNQTWDWVDEVVHYSSCEELFPGWDRRAEYEAKRRGDTTDLEARVETKPQSAAGVGRRVSG